MSNIEDIKILINLKKYLNLLIYEGQNKIFYNDLGWDEKTIDCINAIENILSEREQNKKRIKELEEENKLLLNSKIGIDLSYDDYIPVQKVNDEIERYEYMLAKTIHGEIQKYTPGGILLKIDTLKELLEEK